MPDCYFIWLLGRLSGKNRFAVNANSRFARVQDYWKKKCKYREISIYSMYYVLLIFTGDLTFRKFLHSPFSFLHILWSPNQVLLYKDGIVTNDIVIIIIIILSKLKINFIFNIYAYSAFHIHIYISIHNLLVECDITFYRCKIN